MLEGDLPHAKRLLVLRSLDAAGGQGKRAGLRPVGWHTLRPTFASHLAMRGVPIEAVQERLGLATIEMTVRYAHLSPDVKKDAVRAPEGHPGVTRHEGGRISQ